MTDHELCNDIIEALRHQAVLSNNRIIRLETWVRKLVDTSPHAWVREEGKELLDE